MKYSLVILFLGFIAGGIFFDQIDKTTLMAQAKNEADDRSQVYEQLNLFGEVFDRIRSGYVEDVDSSDLISAAIRGMLTSLDPHSGYMPPENFEDMQVDTKGAFGGLGIEVTQEDGFVKVDDIQYIDNDKKKIKLKIHVGKNRIVRRLFSFLGYKVLELDRSEYAFLNKHNLSLGEWRFLSLSELKILKQDT